jgi:hypothetical protein
MLHWLAHLVGVADMNEVATGVSPDLTSVDTAPVDPESLIQTTGQVKSGDGIEREFRHTRGRMLPGYTQPCRGGCGG